MKKAITFIIKWISNNSITCFWIFAFRPIIRLKPLMFPPPDAKPAELMDYLSFFWDSIWEGVILILIYTLFGYLWIKVKKQISN